MEFSCTELQLLSLCPPRVALSDGTHKSDICTLSESIKCNTIENILFHSEQINAAGANLNKLLHMQQPTCTFIDPLYMVPTLVEILNFLYTRFFCN